MPDEVIQSYCAGTKILQAPVGYLASIETMVKDHVDKNRTLLDKIVDVEDEHVAFFFYARVSNIVDLHILYSVFKLRPPFDR